MLKTFSYSAHSIHLSTIDPKSHDTLSVCHTDTLIAVSCSLSSPQCFCSVTSFCFDHKATQQKLAIGHYWQLCYNKSICCWVCWQGLSEEKSADRLMMYGLNELTPPATTSEWVKFGRTLVGGFALLLWAGAFLCCFAYVIQYIQMGGSSVPQDYVSSIFMTFSA